MNVFSKVTLESLKKNRTRTIVTIIGIMLSAAMICASTTLVSSMQNFVLRCAIHIDGDWYGAVYDAAYKDYEDIRDSDRVSSAAYAQVLGYAKIDSANERKPYLYVLGGDVASGYFKTMPVHLILGTLPKDSTEIILPEHLTSNGKVNYKLGDTVTLDVGDRTLDGRRLGQDTPVYTYDSETQVAIMSGERLENTEPRTYTVVGIYERPTFEDYSAPGYTALTAADTKSADQTPIHCYFKLHKPAGVYDFMKEMGYTQEYGYAYNTKVLLYSGTAPFDSFLTAFYSLAAIIIALIVFGSVSLIYNAFSISVSERTRQFGLLSSVGATRKQLRRMVLFEALAVSIVGIPLGILVGIGGIGIKAGHDIVVVLAVARDGLFAHQLQQTLGIDGRLDGLADHAGGVVEAQIHIAGRLEGAAQLFAEAGGVQTVGAQLHEVFPACDVAAGGGDAAAGVLDEAAHHEVGTGLTGFLFLGELAVAVVHKDDDVGVGGAGGVGDPADGVEVEGVALQIAAAALDVAHLRARGLLGDQLIVRGEVILQRRFVVPDAVVHQGAGALALAVQTDDAFQRVVGTARGGQQGIARPQQAEEGHRQRVGAALELAAHQRILCAHDLRKDLLQLGTAGIPQAVAGGAQHIGGGHLGIGKGLEHLQLVEIPDFLHLAEVGLAQLHGLFVQRQHLGLIIKKVVQNRHYNVIVPSCYYWVLCARSFNISRAHSGRTLPVLQSQGGYKTAPAPVHRGIPGAALRRQGC